MAGVDSYVKFLSHLDGTTTTIVDEMGLHTMSCFGNTTQSDVQKKFGVKSLYFDGAAGSYAATEKAGHADFNFSASNWCIDCWFYAAATGLQGIIGGWPNVRFQIGTNGDPLKLAINLSSDGADWTIANDQRGTTTVTTDAWHHAALTWDGTNYRLFLDGALEKTVASATGIYATSGIGVGCWGDYAGNRFTGYVDEIRISNGAVRWTSAFTPPTEAYSSTYIKTINDLARASVKTVNSLAIANMKTWGGLA